MSLLEEARARKPRPTGPLCKVQRAVRDHPTHAADIITIIRDRTIAHIAAADTFKAHLINIGAQVVEGHRTNGCGQCEYYDTDLSALVDG